MPAMLAADAWSRLFRVDIFFVHVIVFVFEEDEDGCRRPGFVLIVANKHVAHNNNNNNNYYYYYYFYLLLFFNDSQPAFKYPERLLFCVQCMFPDCIRRIG